ncbi:hypothetical protein GAYE_SCF05G2668 [Galdieria yellowstonensis]|uniref:DUF3598 domain-containing protein n=1 Tax=Galdieria yellowstonensis TaxID=3028027 RepID=A0AAV9IBI2_9RHOD|nr:hypothetical protein GAYE_SCF05G2668 [Galdieria yellowstonensis]
MNGVDPLQLRSKWHGTCLVFSVHDAKELSTCTYSQTLERIQYTGAQSFSAVLHYSINQKDGETLKILTNEVFEKTLSLFSDKSYSLEYKEVKLPFCEILAAEAIELCIMLSAEIRVRCFVLYDFDFCLSRVILLRESREIDSLGAEVDRRLAMEEYCGFWVGEGSRIKLASPDHERVDVHSTVRILCDGESVIRKTTCVWNPENETNISKDRREASDFKSRRWLQLRDNSQETVTCYGTLVNEAMATFSVDLEQNVLLLLPFDCFIQAPSFLHADNAFHFEFGCKIHDEWRKRQSRLYSRRGFPLSGMSVVESLSD